MCVHVCVCVHLGLQGRKVAEVLSFSKVNYSVQKGLFGNEDRASRCFLVTVATELFLLSGSIEGALNTLRGISKEEENGRSCGLVCKFVPLVQRTAGS